MSKIIKNVGDLPLGSFVKCFGKKCVIFDHQDGFCKLVAFGDTFNVPFTQRVELLKKI